MPMIAEDKYIMYAGTQVGSFITAELAAQAVRKINAHDALVEALQRSRDWMVEPMGGGLLHERFNNQTKCEAECLRCAGENARALANKEGLDP